MKYADDTALIGLIKEDNERRYKLLVQNFADYCDQNFLELNTAKTKELVINLRREQQPDPILMKNTAVQ
jgi:hypothetical protein